MPFKKVVLIKPALVATVLVAIAVGQRAYAQSCLSSLDLHNRLRTDHDSPLLTWSAALERASQNYANTLASRGCGLVHDPNNRAQSWGENLAAGWGYVRGSQDFCGKATLDWYNEIKDYNFDRIRPYSANRFGPATGHFTQVVWKGTTQVGCAQAWGTGDRCYVVVCKYSPPGNWADDKMYLDNVLPKRPAGSIPSTTTPSTTTTTPSTTTTTTPTNPQTASSTAPSTTTTTPSIQGSQTQTQTTNAPGGLFGILGLGGRTTRTTPCVDNHNLCAQLSRSGYCTPQWTYNGVPVTKLCPMSCGACAAA